MAADANVAVVTVVTGLDIVITGLGCDGGLLLKLFVAFIVTATCEGLLLVLDVADEKSKADDANKLRSLLLLARL